MLQTDLHESSQIVSHLRFISDNGVGLNDPGGFQLVVDPGSLTGDAGAVHIGMLEPTETESRETLDEVIAVFREIYEKAKEDPQSMHDCPVGTYVRRLDEVRAARKPVLRYESEQ